MQILCGEKFMEFFCGAGSLLQRSSSIMVAATTWRYTDIIKLSENYTAYKSCFFVLTQAACLLLTRGGDINATDECGYSALHLAAEHGYVELVQLLLARGARVDYRENNGEEFPRTQVSNIILCFRSSNG
jgi:hypothetical protein